jgi:hypothetical protein
MTAKLGKLTAHNANPYVGYVSSGESVEIISEGPNLICRQSGAATLTMAIVAGMALLGAGFTLTSPDMERHIRQFQHAGIFGKFVAGLLALMIIALFGLTLFFSLGKFFAKSRIVLAADGSLRFYAGFDALPKRIIRPAEIETVSLERVSFPGRYGKIYICPIVVLRLKTQEQLVLCSGTREAPLEQFRQAIAQRGGLSSNQDTPLAS